MAHRSRKVGKACHLVGLALGFAARGAAADPSTAPTEPASSVEPPAVPSVAGPRAPRVQIHGYVSEGAFVSTSSSNDYFGSSSQAGVDQFEAALNFSTEVADRLRVGVQLFARNVGAFRDVSPRVDWAYLDYRLRPWLGLRAGIIKMPFGLYNEYVDTDAARLPILLPDSVYPVRDRDVLLSHTGFSLYGNLELGGAGELEYQAWLGTLTIPRTALELDGATLDRVDTKYVTGAQAFWSPPLEGLRIGATFLRASIDFELTLDQALIDQVVAGGFAAPGYDGKLTISQRPDSLLVGSAEYLRGDWLFAAEYSRWLKRQRTSLPVAIPTFELDSEKLYAMVAYRLSPALEVGTYYSIHHLDVGDRQGHGPQFAKPFYAFQRDLTATLRYDVNDHWLWKLEGHFIDGAGGLSADFNTQPERYWGLFLLRTTVTF